jgi:hypothetical protein
MHKPSYIAKMDGMIAKDQEETKLLPHGIYSHQNSYFQICTSIRKNEPHLPAPGLFLSVH